MIQASYQPMELIDMMPVSFVKLDKDLKEAASTLSAAEARFIVDAYYTVQDYRIRFNNQIRALSQSGEPHELIKWHAGNVQGLEKQYANALDKYSSAHPVGEWLRSIVGIGPVIASGLLAHIDIHKAPTVGHIINFVGYNPNIKWLGKAGAAGVVNQVLGSQRNAEVTEEALVEVASLANRKPDNIRNLAFDKEKDRITRASLTAALAKRPWNADVKKLLFLLGESFIKVQNNPRDIYGKMYVELKRLESEANLLNYYQEQAENALQIKNYGKHTEPYKWYSDSKLPPAHIHARARRYAVRMFLSHLHQVWYEIEYGRPAPRPYAVEHLGHVHVILPPNWPLQSRAAALTVNEERSE